MTKVSEKTKLEVLEESGYRCAVPTCRTVTPLDIHHLVHVSENGGNSADNLLALCPTCHALYHRGTIQRKSLVNYKNQLRRGKVLCEIRIEKHSDSTLANCFEEAFWKKDQRLDFNILGEQDKVTLQFTSHMEVSHNQDEFKLSFKHKAATFYSIRNIEDETPRGDFYNFFTWPEDLWFSVNETVILPTLKRGKYRLSIWTRHDSDTGSLEVEYKDCRIKVFLD